MFRLSRSKATCRNHLDTRTKLRLEAFIEMLKGRVDGED